MKKKYKLEPVLIPRPCWGVNLRSYLKEKEWKKVSKYIRDKANGKCEVCGRPSERLHAHEIWEYDDVNHIQHLKEVKAVCPLCHKAFHLGHTMQTCNYMEVVLAGMWICDINGLDPEEYRKLINNMIDDYERRSKYEWTTVVDDDYLNGLLKGSDG